MGKLTQKQRRELKNKHNLNDKTEHYDLTYSENNNETHTTENTDNTETNETNDEQQRNDLKRMGVLNATDRNLTDAELKQLTAYLTSRKRTIKFNGGASDEITNLTDDIISFHGFTGCYLSILSSATTCEDLVVSFLFQWIKEKHVVMYLKLNADDDVVSFALLHKTDYDPYRKHKNMYVLDYIYTYTNYRNMGHAQSLINKIKQKHEFTALCSSDLSSLVFHKCKLKEMRATIQGLRVMRT